MAGCVVLLLALLVVSALVMGIKITAIVAAIGLVLAVILLVGGGIAGARERTRKADGTFARRYVYVEDDGSAREPTPAEL
jgi:hypothetical protein